MRKPQPPRPPPLPQPALRQDGAMWPRAWPPPPPPGEYRPRHDLALVPWRKWSLSTCVTTLVQASIIGAILSVALYKWGSVLQLVVPG